MHLDNADLGAALVGVLVEGEQPRLVGGNEVGQVSDAISLLLELARLEPVGRDEDEWAGHPRQVPGGLYSGSMFAAASTCSGVSSTTVLSFVEPDRLTLSARAVAASLLGRSQIT